MRTGAADEIVLLALEAEVLAPPRLKSLMSQVIDASNAGIGGLEGTLPGCRLRHARGVELAMAGASDAEITAQIERATDKAAKVRR